MAKQKYAAELYSFNEEDLSFDLVSAQGMDRQSDDFDVKIPEDHNYVSLMLRQNTQTFHRPNSIFSISGRYRKRQLAFELIKLGVNVAHVRDFQPKYQLFYNHYTHPDMRGNDAMFVYIDQQAQDIVDRNFTLAHRLYSGGTSFGNYYTLYACASYADFEEKMNGILGNSIKSTQQRIELFPDLQTYQAFCMSRYHYVAKFLSDNLDAKIIYIPGLHISSW